MYIMDSNRKKVTSKMSNVHKLVTKYKNNENALLEALNKYENKTRQLNILWEAYKLHNNKYNTFLSNETDIMKKIQARRNVKKLKMAAQKLYGIRLTKNVNGKRVQKSPQELRNALAKKGYVNYQTAEYNSRNIRRLRQVARMQGKRITKSVNGKRVYKTANQLFTELSE